MLCQCVRRSSACLNSWCTRLDLYTSFWLSLKNSHKLSTKGRQSYKSSTSNCKIDIETYIIRSSWLLAINSIYRLQKSFPSWGMTGRSVKKKWWSECVIKLTVNLLVAFGKSEHTGEPVGNPRGGRENM